MHSPITFAALTGLALVKAQSPVPQGDVGLAPGVVAPPGAVLISGSPSYGGPVIPGTTGKLGNAQVTTNNPAGVTYTAFLPEGKSSIRGYVSATSSANGTGVTFTVNLSGFPDSTLGPFLYHIHDQPVPSNGDCVPTLGHLDPYIRGEVPPCDATHPETCQVGDLTGKHGNITTNPFQASYVDLFVSTQSGVGAFVGNRSINIHTSNTTRLTCANFTLTAGSGSNTTVTAPTGATTAKPAAFTGAAATSFVGAGAVVAGLIALLL